MPGIRARTADGAEMYPCPRCGGQVYLKLLFIGTAGALRGFIAGMCADCKAGTRYTLPEGVQPARDVDERYYLEAIKMLEIKQEP